jgi:hypothetical protein
MQNNHAQQVQTEIDAAWEAYRKQQREEMEEQYQSEVCPCGHKHDQHYLNDGPCEAPHCGCPQFGEPVENWETYTEVWFTEPPSGHHGYE